MDKMSFLIMLIAFSNLALAQDPAEWQELEFNAIEDYRQHENKILECANFVLRVPAEAADPARRSALSAVSRWMAGTPDYTFGIDEAIGRIMKNNEAVLSIYMASLTKFVLEHPDQANDEDTVKLNAFRLLLDYCEDSNNKVEITKELKKAIKAKNNGKLKEYLVL